MSYNKAQMTERLNQELRRHNSTDGLYSQVLELYSQNPEYPKLAYHNVDHVCSALALFELLVKMSPKDIASTLHLNAARTALAFHDVDHSGYSDEIIGPDGHNNVERAIARFIDFDIDNSEAFGVVPQHLIVGYIRATQFPYVELDDQLDSNVVALIRDADMLWGLMPGNQEQSMIGLWLEQINSGAIENEPCNIEALLTRQIEFIHGYKPASRAGAEFKTAFYNAAAESWALVALEFIRQEEAAKLVSQMTQDEVLRLRSAIKNELPRPTAHRTQ